MRPHFESIPRLSSPPVPLAEREPPALEWKVGGAVAYCGDCTLRVVRLREDGFAETAWYTPAGDLIGPGDEARFLTATLLGRLGDDRAIWGGRA